MVLDLKNEARRAIIGRTSKDYYHAPRNEILKAIADIDFQGFLIDPVELCFSEPAI